MKLRLVAFTILMCMVFLSTTVMVAESIAETNVLILLDASHLMNKRWEKSTRIKAVKAKLQASLETVSKKPDWGYNMGIRIFGDQSPLIKGDCADLRLGAPVEWFDPGVISLVLEGVKPKGRTCLSHGIWSAVDDFKGKSKNSVSSIVLVASSVDDCQIDEFDAVKGMIEQKRAINSVHIIGINLSDDDEKRLSSLAKTGSGYFFNVKKIEDLQKQFEDIFVYYVRNSKPPVPVTEEATEKETKK